VAAAAGAAVTLTGQVFLCQVLGVDLIQEQNISVSTINHGSNDGMSYSTV